MAEEEKDLMFITVLDYQENRVYCYKTLRSSWSIEMFVEDELYEMHGEDISFMVHEQQPQFKADWLIDEKYLAHGGLADAVQEVYGLEWVDYVGYLENE